MSTALAAFGIIAASLAPVHKTAPDFLQNLPLEVPAPEVTIEQEVRRQMYQEIAGQEIPEDTRKVLAMKYGLAPIQFTKAEEKVIRKQNRKIAKGQEVSVVA